jgi:phosphatidylinositol alpha-mannosyltransferase
VKEAELGRACVFCAPNLGGESFGIIVAEAMASSCAIVASTIPAFEHVAGSAARFVAPARPDELAQEIIGLLLDPEAAARLGNAAVERVQRFDGSTVAAEYIAAYEDAIALR